MGLGGEIFSSFPVAFAFCECIFNSLSFYSQAIQWPPNPYRMPLEVQLLLPGLDLGAFKPLGVRHVSEASIKA